MLLCGELTCIRWGARVRINVQTDCHTLSGRCPRSCENFSAQLAAPRNSVLSAER